MIATRLGIASAIVLAAIAEPAFTKTTSAPIEERHAVEQLLSRFLRAFENLDMTTFISCFAEDATVFFPLPEPPQRFAGKARFELTSSRYSLRFVRARRAYALRITS